ncbi:GNAT family N-acetyltransferase [Phanerochaete sordida]|uniref:GNAT family N-acetyltransferase n=1 Tax=Phanerochaete sordida TaxID=48140 RepID=A0A9P3LDK8_9APHY|nr:GNAT family N-acetyltransferase [Phanerochaete sordida]
MSYTNAYSSPPPPPAIPHSELLGPEPYDINWIFPIHPDTLENDRVKLVPFIPGEYGDEFYAETAKDPLFFRYYSTVWHDKNEWLTWLERDVRRNPENIYFAIIDKTRADASHPHRGGSLAGALGFFGCSDAHLNAEIAYVAVFHGFQRTHVASNAIGLLMRFALELPGSSPPGLGLRRVSWRAHHKNLPSVRLAERMGFAHEGTARWIWAVAEERAIDGIVPREGDKWPARFGRHAIILSTCWVDWEGGVRELVQKQMNREN